MTRVPQRYRILHLAHDRAKHGDAITRRDAAWIVGCFELASRIGELEDEGCRFQRTRISDRNQYGDPIHVTAYQLKHAPRPTLRAAGLPAPPEPADQVVPF